MENQIRSIPNTIATTPDMNQQTYLNKEISIPSNMNFSI